MGWSKCAEDNYEGYTERISYYDWRIEDYESGRIMAYSGKSDGIFGKQERTDHSRRSISGKTVGSNKCVGYCEYCGHPGYLTSEQRKEHNCVKKGCNYYTGKKSVVSQPDSRESSTWAQLAQINFA